MNKRKFARAYAGLFPIFLLVALMVVFGLFTEHAALEAQNNVNYSNTVIEDLRKERDGVLSAETGQRGFLLSENPAYLGPYTWARPFVMTTAAQLRHEIVDPDQMARFETLQLVIIEKLDEVTRTVTLAQTGHLDEAIGIVRSNAGYGLMTDIRQQINAMIDIERSSLARRMTKLEATRARVRWVIDIGAIGAALCAAFFFIALLRDQRRRSAAIDDLTRLKDAAQAANRAKSEFLNNMSHELRTPLNAIIGFTQIVQQGVEQTGWRPTYADYLSDVTRSGEHLLGLINAILDLAKMESGQLTLNLEPVDLGELVEASLALVSVLAGAGGVSISTDLPAHCPTIPGDPLKLKQVVINILSNAIKFTDPGGSIAVAVSTIDPWAIIAITDSGQGIGPADLERVMLPFIQVDSSLVRRFGGTGLGLFIARELCALHGGALELTSALGQGTTVTISLPLAGHGAETILDRAA